MMKGRVRSETNKDQEKKEGRGVGIRGRGGLKTAKSREISLQSVADDGDLTSMLGKAFVQIGLSVAMERPDSISLSVVLYVWDKSAQSSIYLSSVSDTFISIGSEGQSVLSPFTCGENFGVNSRSATEIWICCEKMSD